MGEVVPVSDEAGSDVGEVVPVSDETASDLDEGAVGDSPEETEA